MLWVPLRQDISWEPRVDVESIYGDMKYDIASSIKARKEPHMQEVKDASGKIHQSKHIIYTKTKVEINDKLDNELVIQKYDMMTLGGQFFLRRLITI